MHSIISAVTPPDLSMQVKYSCVISLSTAASGGVFNKSPKMISILFCFCAAHCGAAKCRDVPLPDSCTAAKQHHSRPPNEAAYSFVSSSLG
jgi:hypothetical protein